MKSAVTSVRSAFRSWVVCSLWVAYCAGCILWGNDFAKIHVSFPSFPVPLFIGEILLAIGILCSLPEFLKAGSLTKRVIIFYTIALCAVTLSGFHRYGPLALRHAAMFGYVFFALFLYQFSRYLRVVIFMGVILYGAFLPVRFGFPGDEFYAFPLWGLFCFSLDQALRAAGAVRSRRLIMTAAAALVALPLAMFFHTARTFIMANVFSFICLLTGVLLMVRVSGARKILLSVLCVSLLIWCVYFFADRNALRSMKNIAEIWERIEFFEKEYEAVKDTYVIKDVPVAVYRPVDKEDAHVPKVNVQETVVTPAAPGASIESGTAGNVALSETPAPAVGLPADTAGAVPASAIPEASVTAKVPEPRIPLSLVQRGAAPVRQPAVRSYETARQNILFRIFVWKGLFEELFEKRALWGFGLGKPFRPRTTQALGWTDRLYVIDGWVSAHNSWFYLVYLFGVIGLLITLSVWYAWGHMFFRSIRNKDFWGVLLCSALGGWIIGATTQPLLEQPHYVIFFWGLWGIASRRVYAV